MTKEEIRKELELYVIRQRETEELKLMIEDLELGENLKGISYEERVQTSKKNMNNDEVMNRIDSYEKKIRKNEIAIRRVNNFIKMLKPLEVQVIEKIFFQKKSYSKTAFEMDRSRVMIYKLVDDAIETIYNFKKTIKYT